MFDRANARLVVKGETIALPDLSARVLGVLIDHAPDPVSAQELARSAWQLEHVSEDTIAQRIALLRKALGDDPREPAFIRTVRGRGYALVARIEAAGRTLRSAAIAALAGAVVLATLGSGAFILRDEPPPPEPAAMSEVDALLARARAQLGLHQRHETGRAIVLLREALARDPSDPRVQTALSFALSTKVTKFGGGAADIAEAEALARSVVAREPGHGAAWHALGYALDAQGRVDEALAAYQQARSETPEDHAAASSAAYLLKIRGRLHDALILDAQTLGAASASLYRDLQIADALDLLGDETRSRRFADRALLLNPDHPVVLAGLVGLALRRGDLDHAETHIARASAEERQTGELARLTGRIALARGNLESARAAFISAGEAGALDALALDYLTGTATRPVTTLVTELETRGQTWPEFQVRLAEISAAGGEYTEAVNRLHSAIDLGWRDGPSLSRSPFLAALGQDGTLEPVLARIRREAGAQAGLIERDSALLSRLDAVFAAAEG